MKLKVPIERKNICYCGSHCDCLQFNACLNELNQLDICFDEEKLAMFIFEERQKELYGDKFLTYRELVELGGKDEWIIKAKSIIAAMPEILTIRRPNENV
jgi:hypothetical protein